MRVAIEGNFKRLNIACVAAFCGYKLIAVIFADAIPGQPFYGFLIKDWLLWLVNLRELALVVVTSFAGYWIAISKLKHLTAIKLAVWGGCFGGYVGAFFSPLDMSSRIEAWIDAWLPSGLLFDYLYAIAALVLYVGAVPIFLAWVLAQIPPRNANQRPQMKA